MQTTAEQRAAVVAKAQWWLANKAYTVYEEFRPVSFYTQIGFEQRNAAHEVSAFDCSSSTDELMYMVGSLGDPSGPDFNFDGYGNTQTQYEFLPHLGSVSEAQPGDLIMFDPPPESFAHVCVVMESGSNPTVFNHGGPGDPIETNYEAEVAGHPGQAVTVLSIANLSFIAPPPPPPADPYHYKWYDNQRIHLHFGINSEANVVKNYDKFRLNQKKYVKELQVNHANLVFCHTRLLKNMHNTHDPRGLKFHRAFRLEGLEKRIRGEKVANS